MTNQAIFLNDADSTTGKLKHLRFFSQCKNVRMFHSVFCLKGIFRCKVALRNMTVVADCCLSVATVWRFPPAESTGGSTRSARSRPRWPLRGSRFAGARSQHEHDRTSGAGRRPLGGRSRIDHGADRGGGGVPVAQQQVIEHK